MAARTYGKKMSELFGGGENGGLIIKGTIYIPSDFPTLAEVRLGWMYLIGANVTDSDLSKTHTGQSFEVGDEIIWNGTNWTVAGKNAVWGDNGIDLVPITDGRNVNLLSGGLKSSLVTAPVYLGDILNTAFETSNQTIIGAVNTAYQWDRTLLGGSVYLVTPRHAGDILKLKSNIYIGSVDPFSRTQLWNYEANSVIRLGALAQDGDPVNASSEGYIAYGQNAQADVMDGTHWGYFRAKPYRLGIYNCAPAYTGYLFKLDTQSNEVYLKDNDGNKTFDFNRLTSEFAFKRTTMYGIAGLFWDGSSALEFGDSYFGTSIYMRTDGTVDYLFDPAWSTPNQYAIRITNKANKSLGDGGMIGTENGLMFRQTYYDAIDPLSTDEGFFGFGTETNWTVDQNSQDAYAILRLARHGVLVDALKISSLVEGTLYGIWSYNFTPSFTSGSNQLATVKFVEDSVGGENLWDREDLGGSVFKLKPHTATDLVSSFVGFKNYSYNGATLAGSTFLGNDATNKNVGKLLVDATGNFWTYLDLDILADTTSYYYIGRNMSQTLRNNSYIYNYLLQRNIRFGAAGGNVNIFESWNDNTFADGTDLTGTSSSIALFQRKPNSSIGSLGQLTWTCEGTFIGDPALSHHAGFRAYVLNGGNLVPAFYVDKNQNGTLYNIWSYNSAPTFTPGSNQIPTVKYVDDSVGGINYWNRIDLGGSVFAVLPKTTTDKVLSYASFHDRAYNGATLDNELILGADSNHAITRLHTTNNTAGYSYFDVNFFNNNAYLYIGRLTNPRNPSPKTGQYIYNYILQRNIQFAGAGAGCNVLETWCENDLPLGTDLTGTSSSILFNQRVANGSIRPLGQVTFYCDDMFVANPVSQSSGMTAYVMREGNLYYAYNINKERIFKIYNSFITEVGAMYLGLPNDNTIGSWKQAKSGTGLATTFKLSHYEDVSGDGSAYGYVDKFTVDYLGNVFVSAVTGQSLFELTKDGNGTFLRIDSRDPNKQSMIALRKNGMDKWFLSARNGLDAPNDRLSFIYYTGSAFREDAYFYPGNGEFVLNRSLGLKECADTITPGSGFGTLSISTGGDLWYTINHGGTTKYKMLAQFSTM